MKKGFTLVELLAVIVILAIIALIATPIVINIISDTKKSAGLRSADFYLDAVEFSIANRRLNNKTVTNGTYTIMSNGNICMTAITNNTCSDEMIVEVSGEVPTSGTITLIDGKIKNIDITLGNKKIVKNAKGELVYVKMLNEVCKHISGTPKTAGAKYECKVDPKKDPYTFYVLTTPEFGSETIDLIMDRNINSDGTPAEIVGVTKATNASQYNLVAWNNESGQSTSAYGPVTVMQFLYNATKDWTNIDPVNYTYNDKEVVGTTAANTSYTSFVSTNGVSVITQLTGNKVVIGSEEMPLRTRLPITSETSNKTSAPYLYDNLDPYGESGPLGYWLLSSVTWSYDNASSVTENISFLDFYVYYDNNFGVRPVITLGI